MTNQNNVPTAPNRHYYRHNPGSPIIPIMVVLVTAWEESLLYWTTGCEDPKPVQDDGLWLGPVPMPGEWAPREIADCLYYEARNVDNNDSELLSRYAALTGIEATP